MEPNLPVWRKIQKENFTSLDRLCTFLELNEKQKQHFIYRPSFPLNLPKRLAEKIVKGTLDDPILRQFVPLKEEVKKHEEFLKDPVRDCLAQIAPKCLQKYKGRVLLITTGACAMHCRFCFRQNFDYPSQQGALTHEMQLIEKDNTISEIILSGGDPLSLGNLQLKQVLDSISSITHIKRIRFHTRFPIGIPERIDDEFLAILKECPKQIWFIIHSNHHHELDDDVLASLKKIQALAIPVMNQSVLLKDVNDSIETLYLLCEKLIDHGIIPYYLHQLDRVEGTTHFEVSQEKGKYLIQELANRLAGYGIPKYVQEVAFAPSKIPIA